MIALLLVAQSLVLQPDSGAAADDLAPQVTRLVRQLDDRELARREAAEQALIELGPAALEHLPPADDQATGEAAERLARVRVELEQEKSARAADASLLTLQGTFTLEEALAAIKEQTGNDIIDYRRSFGEQQTELELELDLEEVPFWTALDTVLDQAEMSVYPYSGHAGALAITSRHQGETDRLDRGITAGLFRVEAISIDASRNLQIPASSSLSLSLEIAWEPRMQPIMFMLPSESIVAEDNEGNALESAGSGTLEIGVQGVSTAAIIPLHFMAPNRDVQSIAKFSGSFRAVVPGAMETFEFDDLIEIRNEELRKAGVVVTLVGARENGAVFEVQMRVRFDEAGDALASHRGWIFQNEAYLVDANGNRVEDAGFEQFAQGANEIGMSYRFLPEGDPADCTFVYRTPGSLIEMPVEFELTDIPLP